MELLLGKLLVLLALLEPSLSANENSYDPARHRLYGRTQTGLSTNFGGSADKHRGGDSPCLRPARPIERSDWGIAHRSWKCGTLVRVCLVRTRACVVAPVIDKGPYGAVLDPDEEPLPGTKCMTRKSGKVWCIKKKKDWPGTWRGVADLSYAVGAALGHNGKERVRITRVRPRESI